MGLPLFVAPNDGESSRTAANGEGSSSNTLVPILSDGSGLSTREAWADMTTWSTTESSPPFADQTSAEELLNYFPNGVSYTPRLAPGATVRRSPPQTAGIELLLLDSSDLDEEDNSDYVNSDFEDAERIATDYGFRIKIDLYGNYTLVRDFPGPGGSHPEVSKEELRQILLAGLEKIHQDQINAAEPSRSHPYLAYDIYGFYPRGEVPPLPTLVPERNAEAEEGRLSSMMASNIHGMTESLAEATGEYVAMLEQMLDRTRAELDQKTQELAETRVRLEFRDEQVRRTGAYFEGDLY